MKTTVNQTVKDNATRVSPNVVAAAKAAAAADIAKDQRPVNDITKELPKPEAKPAAKKEPTVRAESNEALGERLLKEKANEATILATFTKVYKDKSGVTDKKFVAARAAIYMKIAKKRAEAKATVKKAS